MIDANNSKRWLSKHRRRRNSGASTPVFIAALAVTIALGFATGVFLFGFA